MNLIRLCIDRPVAVAVGVLLVVLFGLLSLFAIPVQLTPTVDEPVISVTTMWPGANPQEIEREIIDRQEEQLRNVQGLRKMSSSATDNMAAVRLEFYAETPQDTALREVNEKLRLVTGYPIEVEEAKVEAADTEIANTIAWLILYSETQDESVRELHDFAEDHIQPYLERVDGVASTAIYGGLEREIHVRVDAGRLAARQLTFRQVELALRRQNENISGGTRAEGKRDYAIRTVGQFESLDEIRQTVIANTPGGPVYVRDVADVELSFKDSTGFVRSLGQTVLAFPVRRRVGANVIHVMDGLKAAIRRVNEEVLQARKLRLELKQVYDETVYIRQAIDMVQSNIVYGSALVLGLLLAFLRSWRATAVLALTIPVSIIGTFMIVVLLGRTLNVISLAGLAFAVGDVVDSAYVVLENIFRHKQMGKRVRQAVLDGTAEVWGPVLVSTLTTLAVFLPVIYMAEEAGQLFRDISIAEVAAVGLSMIVAITVIPPLAARLLTAEQGRPRFAADDAAPGAPRPAARRDPVLWFAAGVAVLVERLNRHRIARAVVIVVMTAGSLVAARFLVPDDTYLPAGNRNLVFGFLLTPPGYSQDEFRNIATEIEALIAPYWQVEPESDAHRQLDAAWVSQIQALLAVEGIPELANPGLSPLERDRVRREWLTPPPLIDNFFFVSWNGRCFMGASSRDPARVSPLVRLLSSAGGRIPGVFAIFTQAQLFRFGSGNYADVQVRGDSLEQVTSAAGAMMFALMQRFDRPLPDPINFNLGRPELRIVPDRERAGELGLNVVDIGFIVEACADGALVGEYRQQGGDTIDIALYVKGQRDRATHDIAQVPLYTPAAGIVPLGAAARLVDTTALEQINHIERQRAVTLQVRPPEAVPLAAVIRQITEEIEPELRAHGQIPPGVTVALTGNADKLAAARAALFGEWRGLSWTSVVNVVSSRFFLSALVVYLLMCALYESWLYPFVIMFSVPLAILGGFLGLSLAHWATLRMALQPVQQFDILTSLGFIMLTGLVVKNAILLVEQSLVYLREHQMPIRAAVREAVHVRVRPVLMTSLTSIVGLLPLAILPGAGSELYRGLASVILGGMFVSTLGTLILVPLVLSWVIEARTWLFGARSVGGAPAVGGATPVVPAPREP